MDTAQVFVARSGVERPQRRTSDLFVDNTRQSRLGFPGLRGIYLTEAWDTFSSAAAKRRPLVMAAHGCIGSRRGSIS